MPPASASSVGLVRAGLGWAAEQTERGFRYRSREKRTGKRAAPMMAMRGDAAQRRGLGPPRTRQRPWLMVDGVRAGEFCFDTLSKLQSIGLPNLAMDLRVWNIVAQCKIAHFNFNPATIELITGGLRDSQERLFKMVRTFARCPQMTGRKERACP